MKTQTSYVTLCGIDLDVDYTVIKPSIGARDSFHGVFGAGPKLEPDDPGGIEIVEVRHKCEDILTLLSKDTLELIEYKLEEEFEEY